MTDTAGTPAEPEQPADEVSEASHEGTAEQMAGDAEGKDPGGEDTGGEDASADTERPPPTDDPPADEPATDKPDPEPEPASSRIPHHWLRWTALGVAVVVLAAAGVGWSLYKKLEGNITQDTGAAAELERYERERPAPSEHDAQNILLIGSDTRSGKGNRPYGRDPGTQRSDTTILLHLAADRKSATAVSVPRDLMVDIPGCRRSDGSRTRPQFAQFNWAFEFGGAACTIRTVEKLTKIRVDHHMIVDFQGFKKMVDAVKGVEVCLKEPINDKGAKLKLKAGWQKLNGEQALGYVRARKSIGNGSDTERMDRQQQFLAALVNKVKSNGVLLNPTRLYPVLDAATSALTTDPALAGLTDLYELVRSMRNIPTEKVQFLTVPRRSYTYDPNRDELVQPDAGRLFDRLRNDVPVEVTPRGKDSERRKKGSGDGSGEDSASDSSADSASASGESGGNEEDSPEGGYWDDEGSWVDEKPGGTDSAADRATPRATGDDKRDEPRRTPSPTPTFRGNTAAGTSCE
ncbi:LCP family protein [Streptomyces sp. LHD-70]|uniref:LCP family protein n=1 Tax=Streptomyces sp. LHD-70 TaxID=3072140 RepID=UPI00280C5DF0|nr:LCP family protein [Streptomyces sp. LHD-70]MDQ8707458.1 LCP family protein [Streptomyces sp. LHD-70]